MVRFAFAYTDQNEKDYNALAVAARNGKIGCLREYLSNEFKIDSSKSRRKFKVISFRENDLELLLYWPKAARHRLFHFHLVCAEVVVS